MYLHVFAGRWEELERLAADLLDDHEDRPGAEFSTFRSRSCTRCEASSTPPRRASAGWSRGSAATTKSCERSTPRSRSACALPRVAPRRRSSSANSLLGQAIDALGASHDAVRNAWPDTLDAALELGRLDAARELLALLSEQPPGHVPPYLRAHLARGRALVAAAEGTHEHVELDLTSAIDEFGSLGSLGYPYWLARVQTDLAAWLIGQDRSSYAAPLLGQATTVLESLGAAPALARAQALRLAQADAMAP